MTDDELFAAFERCTLDPDPAQYCAIEPCLARLPIPTAPVPE